MSFYVYSYKYESFHQIIDTQRVLIWLSGVSYRNYFSCWDMKKFNFSTPK